MPIPAPSTPEPPDQVTKSIADLCANEDAFTDPALIITWLTQLGQHYKAMSSSTAANASPQTFAPHNDASTEPTFTVTWAGLPGGYYKAMPSPIKDEGLSLLLFLLGTQHIDNPSHPEIDAAEEIFEHAFIGLLSDSLDPADSSRHNFESIAATYAIMERYDVRSPWLPSINDSQLTPDKLQWSLERIAFKVEDFITSLDTTWNGMTGYEIVVNERPFPDA